MIKVVHHSILDNIKKIKLIGVVDSKIYGHENDQISSGAGNCQLPLKEQQKNLLKFLINLFYFC